MIERIPLTAVNLVEGQFERDQRNAEPVPPYGAALNQVKSLSCINGDSYAPFVGARRVEAGAQAQGIDKREQPSSTERGEASTRKPPAHSPEPPEISLADRGHSMRCRNS